MKLFSALLIAQFALSAISLETTYRAESSCCGVDYAIAPVQSISLESSDELIRSVRQLFPDKALVYAVLATEPGQEIGTGRELVTDTYRPWLRAYDDLGRRFKGPQIQIVIAPTAWATTLRLPDGSLQTRISATGASEFESILVRGFRHLSIKGGRINVKPRTVVFLQVPDAAALGRLIEPFASPWSFGDAQFRIRTDECFGSDMAFPRSHPFVLSVTRSCPPNPSDLSPETSCEWRDGAIKCTAYRFSEGGGKVAH